MEHTPLGRAGKPEDIVGSAVFLASNSNPIYALYPLAACCQLKGRLGRKPPRPLW
jgi:hypothetical protein